jgi:hypothetical protein
MELITLSIAFTVVVVALGFLAYAGHIGTGNTPKQKAARIAGVVGLVGGILATIGTIETRGTESAYQHDVATYNSHINSLKSPGGYLEPTSVANLNAPRNPTPPFYGAFGALLLFGSLIYLGAFHSLSVLRGLHYVFVAHPAEDVINPALRNQLAIDRERFAAAVKPDRELLSRPPLSFISRNQEARARALKEKLDANADLTRAAINRERARASQQDQKS